VRLPETANSLPENSEHEPLRTVSLRSSGASQTIRARAATATPEAASARELRCLRLMVVTGQCALSTARLEARLSTRARTIGGRTSVRATWLR
jgi:hypothetical protein